METFAGLAVRVSVMYVFALLLLRLSGKRSVGNLTPLDFVVITIVGDLFDDIFWAEVPLAQGLTAFAALLVLHTLMAYLCWKIPALDRLVSSTPTRVIEKGAFRAEGLAAERTSRDEALSEMACLGEDRVADIQAAFWEPSGHLSLLKQAEARPAQRSSLGAGVPERSGSAGRPAQKRDRGNGKAGRDA